MWRISKPDCFIWVVTFLATILLDVPYGLLVGIPFSLLLVVARALAPPHVRAIGRVPGPTAAMTTTTPAASDATSSTAATTAAFEDVRLFANLSLFKGVKIVRLESTLFFGNAEATRDAVVAEVGIDFVKAKKRRRRRGRRRGKRRGSGKAEETEEEREDVEERNPAADGIFHADTTAILTDEDEEEEEDTIDHVIIDCAAVAFTDYVGVMTLGQIVKVSWI